MRRLFGRGESTGWGSSEDAGQGVTKDEVARDEVTDLAAVAAPSEEELVLVRRRASEGSAQARLALAAAALNDDDPSGAVAFVRSALDVAGEDASVLTRASALLRRHAQWASIASLIGPRWRESADGLAAGLDLLRALIELKAVEEAEDVLHQMYLAASASSSREELRRNLRAEEFMLDGLRVTRFAPRAPTVQTRDFMAVTPPTPLWRVPGVDFPIQDGPRVAFVPLGFSAAQPQHGDFAIALPVWLATFLATRTNADATVHLPKHQRGPLTDLHVETSWELMLDLTGLAGQDAILVGGAIRCLGDDRCVEIDMWRDGRRTRVTQHVGRDAGDAARRLSRRIQSHVDASTTADAAPVPSARVLDLLVPAMADAAKLALACAGATPLDLLDRRRERVDAIFDVIQAHPDDMDSRLLAAGLVAWLARAGSPVAAEYRHAVQHLNVGLAARPQARILEQLIGSIAR